MGGGGLKKQQSAIRQGQDSVFRSQNLLVDFQGEENLRGATLQRDAAFEEAKARREQADLLYEDSQWEQAQKARDIRLTVASQEHGYLSAGVDLMGSPLAVTNETRALGAQELEHMESRGKAVSRLVRLQANQIERGGLANLLTAQGQNVINRGSTTISQRQQRMDLENKFEEQRYQDKQQRMQGLFGLGKSLLGAIF